MQLEGAAGGEERSLFADYSYPILTGLGVPESSRQSARATKDLASNNSTPPLAYGLQAKLPGHGLQVHAHLGPGERVAEDTRDPSS